MNYMVRNHGQFIIRSIALGQNNWIYAGEQDDFGYFYPQKNNSFTDIWEIGRHRPFRFLAFVKY